MSRKRARGVEVRVGLDEIAEHFESLEDPRSDINQRHPFVMRDNDRRVCRSGGGRRSDGRRAMGRVEGGISEERPAAAQRGSEEGCLPAAAVGRSAGRVSGVLRRVAHDAAAEGGRVDRHRPAGVCGGWKDAASQP